MNYKEGEMNNLLLKWFKNKIKIYIQSCVDNGLESATNNLADSFIKTEEDLEKANKKYIIPILIQSTYNKIDTQNIINCMHEASYLQIQHELYLRDYLECSIFYEKSTLTIGNIPVIINTYYACFLDKNGIFKKICIYTRVDEKKAFNNYDLPHYIWNHFPSPAPISSICDQYLEVMNKPSSHIQKSQPDELFKFLENYYNKDYNNNGNFNIIYDLPSRCDDIEILKNEPCFNDSNTRVLILKVPVSHFLSGGKKASDDNTFVTLPYIIDLDKGESTEVCN